MKNLVRGTVILSIISLFVALIYAQSKLPTETATVIANDSQPIVNNSVSTENNLSTDDKKLVKKTVMEKAASSGLSKGSFTATAYCLRGRTAMGHGVRRGIIAADPRVLRLGSRINLGAGAYSGEYLVSDTGGGIRGRRLDIWVPNCSEARRFGRRTVTVFAAQ
jgi:3D (Asp-Asp-Asp) domain-containing protein